MFNRILRWREERRLDHLVEQPGLAERWERVVAPWSAAARFRGDRRDALLRAALRFLLRKQIMASADFQLDDDMRLLLATMAVVPVLNLGLDWYRGFSSVIVYETAFIPDGEWEDEYGIVHTHDEALSGEAWPQGPVILSWQDVLEANGDDAYNVVIHEMAHKLDMLDDGANGAPPLHRDMDASLWQQAFAAAFEDLARASAEHATALPIDPYALHDSGEFFAVSSECFFEAPERLARAWPAVFSQLCAFYRQDPRQPA